MSPYRRGLQSTRVGVDFVSNLWNSFEIGFRLWNEAERSRAKNLGAFFEVFFVRSTLEPWNVLWMNDSNMRNIFSESIKCNENVNL